MPTLEVGSLGEFSFTKVLQKVQNTKHLALITPSPDELFEAFAAHYRLVEAGGGLVTNPAREVLMIFRRGCWDLPKGKRERGEEISACALREVEEECGIEGLELGALLHTTYHTYEERGEQILKKSYWYAMRVTGSSPLTPQTEEGITEVRWVGTEEIATCLAASFATIAELFEAAGYALP